MLFKFTTNCVPPCTPNCTPKGWFQDDSNEYRKNKKPCKSYD